MGRSTTVIIAMADFKIRSPCNSLRIYPSNYPSVGWEVMLSDRACYRPATWMGAQRTSVHHWCYDGCWFYFNSEFIYLPRLNISHLILFSVKSFHPDDFFFDSYSEFFLFDRMIHFILYSEFDRMTHFIFLYSPKFSRFENPRVYIH